MDEPKTVSERLAEYRFQARTDRLQKVRQVVRQAAEAKAAPPELTDCLVLAVDEACANIIRHAYGPGRAGDIILEIDYSAGELIFRLRDFAAPVDRTVLRSRNVDELRPGGLGIHLIQEIMDSYEFLEPAEGQGNVLVMRKRIDDA
jgi:sigma-B regulation protein RsbU (phosphoserine phosphatase)